MPFTETFGAELPAAEERIGALTTQSVFLNAHFDHPLGERVVLHAGLGFWGLSLGLRYALR